MPATKKGNEGFPQPSQIGVRLCFLASLCAISTTNGCQFLQTDRCGFVFDSWLAVTSRFNSAKKFRQFTRLRLNRATAWQAAAFPRKAF